MRISPGPGIIRIAPDQTPTKTNSGGIMMIKKKGRATHPMKNIKIKFVISLGNLLKDSSVYQRQDTIILKRQKQEEIGVKILNS